MADKKRLLMADGGGGAPEYVPQTLKDLGDGTFAPVIQSNASGSTDVSSLAKDNTLKDGTLRTGLVGSSTATVTTQTTLATVTTVLAANANRKGAKFTSVTGTILLKYGTGASTSSYTERIVTNGSHELAGPEPYKGVVTAIGAGTLNVTEW